MPNADKESERYAPRGELRELPPVVAGSIGGAAAAIVSYPFDTLKVRMQSGHPAHKLLRGISPLGIFKGVSTPISMVTPLLCGL